MAYDVVTTSRKKFGVIFVIQTEKGLKHGDVAYVVAMVENKSDVYQEVCDAVVDLFHKIELEPSIVVPAMAPYRMSLDELVELRKQLTYLLDCGMIQPSDCRYCSKKKHDGSSRMHIDYRTLNMVTIKKISIIFQMSWTCSTRCRG